MFAEMADALDFNVADAPPRRVSNGSAVKELSSFAASRRFAVTSTTGGRHNAGSAHYRGFAVDVNVRGKTAGQVEELMNAARSRGYLARDERSHPSGQKVWSGAHIHLEKRAAGGNDERAAAARSAPSSTEGKAPVDVPTGHGGAGVGTLALLALGIVGVAVFAGHSR